MQTFAVRVETLSMSIELYVAELVFFQDRRQPVWPATVDFADQFNIETPVPADHVKSSAKDGAAVNKPMKSEATIKRAPLLFAVSLIIRSPKN